MPAPSSSTISRISRDRGDLQSGRAQSADQPLGDRPGPGALGQQRDERRAGTERNTISSSTMMNRSENAAPGRRPCSTQPGWPPAWPTWPARCSCRPGGGLACSKLSSSAVDDRLVLGDVVGAEVCPHPDNRGLSVRRDAGELGGLHRVNTLGQSRLALQGGQVGSRQLSRARGDDRDVRHSPVGPAAQDRRGQIRGLRARRIGRQERAVVVVDLTGQRRQRDARDHRGGEPEDDDRPTGTARRIGRARGRRHRPTGFRAPGRW